MGTPRLPDLALSRAVLDRADALRSQDGVLAGFWADPLARLLVLRGDQAQVVSARRPGLVLVSPSDAGYAPGSGLPQDVFFLGRDGDVPYFGLATSAPSAQAQAFDPQAPKTDSATAAGRPSRSAENSVGTPTRMATLREVGAQLSALDSELFTTTQALANWHATHQRCSRCGAPTEVIRGGWVRRCSVDDSEHYPRTDPAVIMLVTDPADRALLGRRAGWAPQWFSTLAGFVEPGESAEAAVVREVGEEAGVAVDPNSVVALGSQPWPFPSSLMLGFRASSIRSTDPTPDIAEIAEARWFTRDELREQCEAGTVAIPPAVSIARHLIQEWYGAQLPGSWIRP